ncbi:MAG TPA: RNA-binding S4 domain-containing protein [Candidatus Cybelea sp.]|nr:RNA-binding S4 domain-containing protein [Candidatus Cybelea sp.]
MPRLKRRMPPRRKPKGWWWCPKSNIAQCYPIYRYSVKSIALLAANKGLVRLDKFMKVSRLAKRRSEAHEALEHGRITREGKALKPGYQVKAGDVLEIHYATKFVTVRVREVPLRVTPAVVPSELYEILDSRRDEAEWL